MSRILYKIQMVAAASVAVTGLSLVVAPAAWADSATGVSPATGLSGTNFNFLLPSGAKCSGDTATGGFKLYSYVVDNSVVPVSSIPTLNFSTGAANQGAALIDTGGVPYEQNATLPTSGQVPTPPTFSWSAYQTDFGPGLDLHNGTFNVGIVCANSSGAVDGNNFWNEQFTFAATNDANVFSWSTQSNPTPEVGYAVILPAAGAAVLAGGVVFMRRMRRSTAMAA